jgi:nitrite reductase/ring-hydroxylating ferredoxin subunit
MKVVVGRVCDFRNGDRKIIDVNGKSIGVFRVDDQFYAIRNRCPHQWGPLCLGDFAPRAVSGEPGDVHLDAGPPLIACPWHGWEYDLATGEVAHNRKIRLRRFEVTVEDGVVYVDA